MTKRDFDKLETLETLETPERRISGVTPGGYVDKLALDPDDPRIALSQIHVGAGREKSGKATHWPMRSEFLAHINRAFLGSRDITGVAQKVKSGQLLEIEEAFQLLRYKSPEQWDAVEMCFLREMTIPQLAKLRGVTPQTISYRKRRGLALLQGWTKNQFNSTV